MEFQIIEYKENNDERIDKYLATIYTDWTRNQIQIMIEEGLILINNKEIKPSYRLKYDDQISIEEQIPVLTDILAQDVPLNIVYEDKDIIVINKDSGMVVHPAPGNLTNTLVNALMYHCQDLSGINGKIRAGIVHRIDKDTSGLLVACKNDRSHKDLSEQFANHTVKKIYYALCHGVITHNMGVIDAPIGRNPNNRQQMAVVENGKPAKTHFKVLKRYKEYTLVEVNLETGRTHQIRVHMKYIGFPLVGDPIYGLKKNITDNGQLLHSKKLEFVHPISKKKMLFETSLPDYFENILKNLDE